MEPREKKTQGERENGYREIGWKLTQQINPLKKLTLIPTKCKEVRAKITLKLHFFRSLVNGKLRPEKPRRSKVIFQWSEISSKKTKTEMFKTQEEAHKQMISKLMSQSIK